MKFAPLALTALLTATPCLATPAQADRPYPTKNERFMEYFQEGLTHSAAGKYGLSVTSFEAAAALGDSIDAPADYLVDIYQGLANIRHLEATVLASQGLAGQARSVRHEAIVYRQLAVDCDPGNPLALHRLAYALAEQDSCLGTARELAQQAVSIDPCSDHLATLGIIEHKLGEYMISWSTLDRALHSNPLTHPDVVERYQEVNLLRISPDSIKTRR